MLAADLGSDPYASKDPAFAGSKAAGSFGGVDGGDAEPSNLPVSRLQIGNWSLQSKHNEHLLLTFYYDKRKLVWEVLHVGVVRKMESDFDDVRDLLLSLGPSDTLKMTIELARPPRFYKEQAPSAGARGNFIFTSDFTNGQASHVSRHVLIFANGVLNKHIPQLRASGLAVRVDKELQMEEQFGGGEGSQSLEHAGTFQDYADPSVLEGGRGLRHPTITSLRAPPTSSPRLDAITLQEQLDREMRDRQARYVGICPIRAEIYANVFDELITAITLDSPKRGLVQRMVRDESRMTIDAYRTVYESSIKFGARKLTQAVTIKGDMEHQMADLETEIEALKLQVKDQRELCSTLEYRTEQADIKYAQKDKDVETLEETNKQLELLLAALSESTKSKDKS